MKRTAVLFAVIAGALAISGCGFQPIYATRDDGALISSQINLERIVAPENLTPYLEDAFNARIVSVEGVAPRYDLYVQAREKADRLAVQIDATVTRYNYRLVARYWVIDKETGKKVRGVARAITSYNIVNSQYSTLFAERAAIEKAARQLAEQIERDMLIRFSRPADERDDVDPEAFESVLEQDEILNERRQPAPDQQIELPEELYYLEPEAEQPAGATTDTDNPGADNSGAGGTGGAAATSNATPDVPDPVIDGRP